VLRFLSVKHKRGQTIIDDETDKKADEEGKNPESRGGGETTGQLMGEGGEGALQNHEREGKDSRAKKIIGDFTQGNRSSLANVCRPYKKKTAPKKEAPRNPEKEWGRKTLSWGREH